MVECWRGYLSGARCRLAYGPADATATQSVASVKSRLVLPFWYRLTRVVLDKGPLNGGVRVCYTNVSIFSTLTSSGLVLRRILSVHMLHALFVLSQVVVYFCTHGSTVYMASLDASKAFDRVNHIKLFKRLIDRGLPSHVIKILINWYGEISVL